MRPQNNTSRNATWCEKCVPASLIQTLSWSQVWMSFDYIGMSYGHSISPVRFSYAKTQQTTQGNKTIHQKQWINSCDCIWTEESRCVFLIFKSPTSIVFWLKSNQLSAEADTLWIYYEITGGKITSLLSEYKSFCVRELLDDPILCESQFFCELKREIWRLKKTTEKPLVVTDSWRFTKA